MESRPPAPVTLPDLDALLDLAWRAPRSPSETLWLLSFQARLDQARTPRASEPKPPPPPGEPST